MKEYKRYTGVYSSNSGYFVRSKKGVKGRTYHKDKMIDGRVMVYTEECNLLCNPENLIIIGFID